MVRQRGPRYGGVRRSPREAAAWRDRRSSRRSGNPSKSRDAEAGAGGSTRSPWADASPAIPRAGRGRGGGGKAEKGGGGGGGGGGITRAPGGGRPPRDPGGGTTQEGVARA